MVDLKLRKVYEPVLTGLQPSDLTSPACKAAFENYFRNVNRAAKMIEAPVFAAYSADARRQAMNGYYFERFGTITPTEEQVLSCDFTNNLEAAVYLQSLFDRQAGEPQFTFITNSLVRNLDGFVMNSGGEITEVFESLLKAIVVESWTALEILFEDLWTRAVNEHPKYLGKAFPPGSRESYKDALAEFNEEGFNIQDKLGTILGAKFEWHKREHRIQAYTQSFYDGVEVVNLVKNPQIEGLSHLRNMITHTGGILDQNFFNKTGSGEVEVVLRDIRAIGIRKRVPIDGVFVSRYALDPLTLGFEVIRKVDEWIAAH